MAVADASLLSHRAPLGVVDPEIASLLKQEEARQEHNLELIASENIASLAVREAMGSTLSDKYAEGYPGKRYYGGCEVVDEVEKLAIERVKQLYGAQHANVQPHSGAQANMAVYFALLKPGDTLMAMNLAHGGHLTHGSHVNFSGQFYNIVPYGVREDTERVDYDELRRLAREHKPKMIVSGATAYSRTWDFKEIRSIADEVGALHMCDMAHYSGLIAAGEYPSPVGHAHIVTSTTHKSIRGPRGGMILCEEEFAKDIDKTVFPGIQGGPLMHVIAGKAVCFKEAMSPEFAQYQKQILANAKAMVKVFQDRGFEIVSGGTDDHLFLLSLVGREITGKEADEVLGRANITVNKNAVPNDPRPPFVTSGIRIGSPAGTRRGFGTKEFSELAGWICDLLEDSKNEKLIADVKQKVLALCKKFPVYGK